MEKGKRKKIFYIPGIISLIFVPIAFIYFASRQQKELSVSTMSIFWADTNYLSRIYRHFPPNRNYTEIIFTGNNKDDETKLNFSQIRIREIFSRNDSINGLHFNFMNGSEYWTIIKTLDILEIEGAKTYIALDNNLWFYNVPLDITATNRICVTTYNDNFFVKPKISFWEEVKQQIRIICSNSWKLIVAFLFYL